MSLPNMRVLQRARRELSECFDAPVPELASVFLLLTIYHMHRLDLAKLVRYAGFSRQTLLELPSVPGHVAAAVRLLQVCLPGFLKCA